MQHCQSLISNPSDTKINTCRGEWFYFFVMVSMKVIKCSVQHKLKIVLYFLTMCVCIVLILYYLNRN